MRHFRVLYSFVLLRAAAVGAQQATAGIVLLGRRRGRRRRSCGGGGGRLLGLGPLLLRLGRRIALLLDLQQLVQLALLRHRRRSHRHLLRARHLGFGGLKLIGVLLLELLPSRLLLVLHLGGRLFGLHLFRHLLVQVTVPVAPAAGAACLPAHRAHPPAVVAGRASRHGCEARPRAQHLCRAGTTPHPLPGPGGGRSGSHGRA
mmetsp:Transcript_43902/g.113422  ORF Transcript_43902/g.113422 Transcript_43902/m.113422 type:complete len:203 (+) Transcript_43902:104-712(+)